jgi:hypothetical protein
MDRKLEGDAAGIPYPGFDSVCQRDVMPIARYEIAAGLSDSDNRAT